MKKYILYYDHKFPVLICRRRSVRLSQWAWYCYWFSWMGAKVTHTISLQLWAYKR